jgi:hypothetical protein
MGIFGRRKPERARREVIKGHAWIDPVLDAALAELGEGGHLRAATTVLAEVREDTERRDLRLGHLANELVGHADEIGGLAVDHGDPELHLLAGAAFVAEASAIRGAGWASTVGEDRAKMVRSTTRKAVPFLHAAAELLPGDAVPWHELMNVCMLLGADRAEHDRAWGEVAARYPTYWTANQSRMQVLAEKWYGSHQEMLAFAEEAVQNAPAGDPLTALDPMAMFEVWMLESRDSSDADALELGREIFGKMLPRLAVSADKWLRTEQPHVRTIAAHNNFAAAFGLAGQADRTLLHLLGMRDRLTGLPWGYFPGTPEDVHHALVLNYWPEDLVVADPEPTIPG